MQVDLLQNGVRVAQRVYAAENRPNNNCAGSNQVPEALLVSGAPFDIALSSIAAATPFNGVVIHLQGYGCNIASNSITTANFRITF
jgi:hypothetical protein